MPNAKEEEEEREDLWVSQYGGSCTSANLKLVLCRLDLVIISSLNIMNEMEGVFLKFDSYKFEADQRFLDGLQKTNISTDDRLLDMKLFFYNRFIEPIDQRTYKRWRSSLPKRDDHSGQLNQEILPDTDSIVSKNQSDETSADTEMHRLSFEEVMRLVQEGKPVPGVTKLDIQPSNHNPTPSQMERKTKPWELPSVSS